MDDRTIQALIFQPFRNFDSKPSEKFPEVRNFTEIQFYNLTESKLDKIIVPTDQLEKLGIQNEIGDLPNSDLAGKKIPVYELNFEFIESKNGKNWTEKLVDVNLSSVQFSLKEV